MAQKQWRGYTEARGTGVTGTAIVDVYPDLRSVTRDGNTVIVRIGVTVNKWNVWDGYARVNGIDVYNSAYADIKVNNPAAGAVGITVEAGAYGKQGSWGYASDTYPNVSYPARSFTVTFDAAGGAVTPQSKTVVYGEPSSTTGAFRMKIRSGTKASFFRCWIWWTRRTESWL